MLRRDLREFLSGAERDSFPGLSIILVAGMGFFHYQSNRMWPTVAERLGGITQRQIEVVRESFARSCDLFGLPVMRDVNGRQLVDMAILMVGIPVDYADTMVEVAASAMRGGEAWREWDGPRWSEEVKDVAPSQIRLREFAAAYPEAMKDFLDDLVTAQQLADEHPGRDISALLDGTSIRPEYAERVPKFREFLDPDRPTGHLPGNVNLHFDPEGDFLVSVPQSGDPDAGGTWEVRGAGGVAKRLHARRVDPIPIGELALETELRILRRKSDRERLGRTLRGLGGWDFFSADRGRLESRSDAARFPKLRGHVVAREPFEVTRHSRVRLPDGETSRPTRVGGSTIHALEVVPATLRSRDDAWLAVRFGGSPPTHVRFAGEGQIAEEVPEDEGQPRTPSPWPVPICWLEPDTEHGDRGVTEPLDGLVDVLPDVGQTAALAPFLDALIDAGAAVRDRTGTRISGLVIDVHEEGVALAGTANGITEVIARSVALGLLPRASRVRCGRANGLPVVIVTAPGKTDAMRQTYRKMHGTEAGRLMRKSP